MSAIVTTSNSFDNLPAQTLLGEQQKTVRIPVGGKIRGGIKALKNADKKNTQALDIYERGCNAGASFDYIQKRINDELKTNIRLIPQNIPYFVSRRCDFSVPEVADLIMNKYGEDREDGFHLYRFPVIFPVDNWQVIMPHGLKCYTASQLLFWSEYGNDGARYCKTKAQATRNEQNNRAKRCFGGRQSILRPDNNGICDPNECREYQDRKCNMTGSLMFYVPGIPGSSAIELPTNSFYSLQQMRQQLEMVSHIRGGKISGTFNGKPIFYLTKQRRKVSMLDDNGNPKKVNQWIVELEADIDMTKMFEQSENQYMLEKGNDAAKILEISNKTESEIIDPVSNDESENDFTVISNLLEVLAIDYDYFNIYAAKRWGDWHKCTQGVIEELQEGLNNPEIYRQQVKTPF